jgi:hypothetical protein
MTLHWKFTYDGEPQQFNLSQLGNEIMPEFGLDESEYQVLEDYIDGTPELFTGKWISPVRYAVYGIEVRPQKDESSIWIEIKLYKLFVTPLMIVGVILLMDGLSGWLVALIFYGLSVFLAGSLTLAVLYGSKEDIEKKIKALAKANQCR